MSDYLPQLCKLNIFSKKVVWIACYCIYDYRLKILQGAEHCSAPYHALDFLDYPDHADIDETMDIRSLGCILHAIM